MKALLRRLIVSMLAGQVWKLRARRNIKVVAVAGSIGKTSTKFAIAQLLGAKFRVRFQEGNYNVPVTVPLVFFGLPIPSLMNPFAWLITMARIKWALLRPYPYDVVVVELGTDGPGQLIQFKEILQADVGVLTAIAPEHMEFFDTMAAVGREEISIGAFSRTLLVNADLCAPQFIQMCDNPQPYGAKADKGYHLVPGEISDGRWSFTVQRRGEILLEGSYPAISMAQLYSLCAAVAVGNHLGMNPEEMRAGLQRITPVSGRMQLLRGVKGTTIIDETYNASPEAVKSALDALYAFKAPYRVALLGNMNELGALSASAHSDVGAYCDPKFVDLVVTLGRDANEYTASAAERKGCRVLRCASPYEAADLIAANLQEGAVILAKGSQNGVFAEEAVKQLLRDPADANKLVRQSAYWMKRKANQFKDPAR